MAAEKGPNGPDGINNSDRIYGIGFGINADKLQPLLPLELKTRPFSALIPGVPATYVYATETAYYDQYAASYYAFTWKKAGWDCMRHYEILAAGALPYFVDLTAAPPDVMPGFPRDLVLQAMHLPGVGADGTIDFAVFPKAEYERLRRAIRVITMQQLITAAVATRLLTIAGYHCSASFSASSSTSSSAVSPHQNSQNPRVLFLSGSVDPDYMRCTLLVGLKQALGPAAVLDVPKVPHVYASYPESAAQTLYGRGFSYTRALADDPPLRRDHVSVVAAIRARAFALVIYGSMHRGTPYLEEVCAAYAPHEVVFVCGEDTHVCHRALAGSWQFVRERHCLTDA
jgi:hypothetical protein